MYLDDDEAGAGVVGALEINVRLIVRDVEALDGRALLEGGGGCAGGQGGEEQDWADNGGAHDCELQGQKGECSTADVRSTAQVKDNCECDSFGNK